MHSQILGTRIKVIQLDRHIEILLLDNDCVIVPGLGGFMAHHISASYSAESQMFIPPTRQLGFNPQLQINDSLLAQSYIEAYDISYPEALRRIDDEVTELRQKIQNEGCCELNDIGILRLNEEGKIEFEPCEAGILTPWLYGLNTIEMSPLAILGKPELKKPAAAQSPIISEEPKPIPQLTKHTVSDEDDDSDRNDSDEECQEPHITIRISTLKHIGTVAAAVIALFVCAIPFGKMVQPELSKSYLDTGILYNILPEGVRTPDSETPKQLSFKDAKPVIQDNTADATPTAADKNPSVQSNAGTDVTVEKKATEAANSQASNLSGKGANADDNAAKVGKDIEKPASTHFFSIVLASRVPKSNAEDFVGKLKKNGFDKAEVIVRNNGAKVIYGRFQTEAEAQKLLRGMRTSAEAFADGWIMEF